MRINRSLPLSRELIYKNNPSAIVILDSRNISVSIEEMDLVHKALGMKMFGYHYMVYRDGTIHAGRPERSFSCDVTVVTQSIQENTNNDNESPFDDLSIEVESATNIISSGRIFVCLEGNTEFYDMTYMQRNALIELCKNIKSRNRNVRGMYSLSEIIENTENLGVYVDMNSIRAEVNSTLIPAFISTPAGGISYTYGGRDLIYNSSNPISGNDVKLVQIYLKTLDIPIRDTAGIYNLFTHNAVKDFQRMFNLEVTGIMSDREFNMLKEKVRNLAVTIDYSLYHRLLYYRKDNMMRGDDVDNIQSKLARLNYIKLTGYFDEQMEEGVKLYQYDNKLTQDGEIGPITWRTIMNSVGVEFGRTIVYIPENPMYGDDVRLIQKRISQIARRYGIITYSVNGEYDEITYNNIRKIQSQINFPIDGIVDDKMFDFLVNT